MTNDLQRANMWKRISAFLFDAILAVILAVGFGYLLSLLMGTDKRYGELESFYLRYETEYGIDLDISEKEYLALDEETKARFDAAGEAMSADAGLISLYNQVVSQSILIVSLSILLAFLVWEFVLPLCLRNGQTPGKKIFGIAVMHPNSVRIRPAAVFVRGILGKCVLETMLPAFVLMWTFLQGSGLFGLLFAAGLGLIQLIAMIATRTNSAIHDLMAYTVAVELSSQMIFDTPEAAEAYYRREQQRREQSLSSPY